MKATPLRRQPLPKKDWLILALQAFFFLTAVTLELYWVRHSDELVARSETDLIAAGFRLYGAADRAYYVAVTPFTLSLETIKIFFTQPLILWLAYAILARKPYRHPLQLALASYVSYSVLLYFWTAHLSGYADLRSRDLPTFLLFYVANLPWLLGHLYMVYDSARAITARFSVAAAPAATLVHLTSPEAESCGP